MTEAVSARTVPERETLIQVGHVHTAYGIKGWVWVMSRTEPIANIFEYGPWYLDRAGTLEAVELAGHRAQGKGLVACIAGCDDRNAADRLLGSRIGTAAAHHVAKGEFGIMVAARGEETAPVPLSEVAGNLKLVPLDHEWIQTARKLGTGLGES